MRTDAGAAAADAEFGGGTAGAEDRATRHSSNADSAATIPARSERGPEGVGHRTDAFGTTSTPHRFADDPTHGITTDPVTGRRYVLAYVEMGTRVVEALHRENRLQPDDEEFERWKRRVLRYRFKAAKRAATRPEMRSQSYREGTRWTCAS